MTGQPGQKFPLRPLISGVSAHLDILAAEVLAIEHILGEEGVIGVVQTPDTITRLQRLDFSRQSLEDLALLTNIISPDIQGLTSTDLAQRLRLDVTKHLLDIEIGQDIPLSATLEQGDIDLF
ncbi:MAG: hypothetical protein P8N14_08600 [Sulfitobacter sp.]|nr:hypothetical protein [Sulfitobacter sp.]